MKKYDIAAYIWPSYTGQDGRTRIFWPEGNGEWETVRNAKALFPGHIWPRVPLWGYVDEADPYVMQMEIDAAVDHGVNVFIYDWYWYDNRPFLEGCLNDGFLKAKNRSKMKFYLMWANHDATYRWDRRISTIDETTAVWNGTVTKEQFRIIGERWLNKYFSQPEYYQIENRPVVAIYDMQNFINSFGCIKNAAEEMERLELKAIEYGFKGIHYQFIKNDPICVKLDESDTSKREFSFKELLKYMPFKSVTHYQYCHITDVNRDYCDVVSDVVKGWDKLDKTDDIPYFPHVSIGWDDTPRFYKHTDNIIKNNTPEEFEKALIKAKEYTDKHNDCPLITINSWNEWTETSYLEPCSVYGYGYLNAVKNVFLK